MTNEATKLREAWLGRLAAAMAPVLAERAGLSLGQYRVTCGFPSRGGELGRKKVVIGQAWASVASADRHAEVFISPVLDDAMTVAATLAHELVHVALPGAGHRAPFAKACRAIGLLGPWTATKEGPDFIAWVMPLLAELGAYPHAKLNAMAPIAAPKKQKARLIKCECEACGYTVRTTRVWIDTAGAPHCPLHGAMAVDGDAGDAGDEVKEAA